MWNISCAVRHVVYLEMRTTENTFQNINGHELEVQFVENNKSIGVLIKRLNYDEEEKSKIKRILIELICCMLLYGICGVHKAIVIACLILLISASFEIYLVVTSLEFGKSINSYNPQPHLYIKCRNQKICFWIPFNNCRKIRLHRRLLFTIYSQTSARRNTHFYTHWKHWAYCYKWSNLRGMFCEFVTIQNVQICKRV